MRGEGDPDQEDSGVLRIRVQLQHWDRPLHPVPAQETEERTRISGPRQTGGAVLSHLPGRLLSTLPQAKLSYLSQVVAPAAWGSVLQSLGLRGATA